MSTAPAASLPQVHEGLAEQLRAPIRDVLGARVAGLLLALPPRPDTVCGRYEWWRALTPAQARQASLLDHLESLCGHLDGHLSAPGCAPGDLLPEAALEAADGFTGPVTTPLVAAYRARRRAGT